MILTKIQKNLYLDSIFLMSATQGLLKTPGVSDAVLVMGSDMNKTVLAEFGADAADYAAATPNDLVIALVSDREAAIEEASETLSAMLKAKSGGGGGAKKDAASPTLSAAVKTQPDTNLVYISIPGEFVYKEARAALEDGRNVFIFSDNVPLEDEVALKNLAREKDLWVMGPGCGTTAIGGVSVGMMSKIGRGPIGIVGASGSGIHEIAALIDQAGQGITHAIGTGGRDLSKDVGGITMEKGIRFMLADADTKVIVLVSKPPHPEVAEKLLALASGGGKPVVVFFLGGDEMKLPEGIIKAQSLEDAADKAVALATGAPLPQGDFFEKYAEILKDAAKTEAAKLSPGQKYLRGLFCGGTHNEEAILTLKKILPKIHANVSFGGCIPLENVKNSIEHSLIDMGDEEFTRGKPHPVMDPSVLKSRLMKEALDPEVAVVLFDLLLGYGANADPAAVVADTLAEIQTMLKKENREVCLVASITGTQRDPQDLNRQIKTLENLGVTVLKTNVRAALFAGYIATGGRA